jgi:SNF2 family DNA or RNA helicase
MRPRSALFENQAASAAWMVEHHQTANFGNVGDGKTAATLTALHDLGRPRTLVLAPARVADTVWAEEAAQWEHLHDMKVLHATGDRAQRFDCMEDASASIVTLSYENFPHLLKSLRVPALFDAIVFDELSRMKAVDSVKFRQFRGTVRDIPIRYGLTGTPVGNHLLDLWGEMFMVAGEKPLGPTKGEYVGRYFTPGAILNGRIIQWNIRAGAQREIEQRIKPYAFTMKATGPARAQLRDNPIRVKLPPEVEEMAERYVQELTVQLASGADLYAFSRTTAAMQARQMVSGAVYLKPPMVLGEPPPTERKWEQIHNAKVQALDELVGELQGEPLLVFYWFQHERDRILTHFGSRAKELDSSARIDQWNRREVEVMLAHPASAGHGLNLQFGGHNQCWFTLPYSLEMFMQANGRLPRPGQKNPWINNHVLMAGRSDEAVLSALRRKDTVQSELLGAMLV